MNKIEIIIDYRESNEILKEAFRSNHMINLKTGKLKAGDFLINNLLLVERKTIKDFVMSIKDGRLFQQAANLGSSFKHRMLILEGGSNDIKNIKMARNAIQGALISLSLKFRIPVLRSVSPNDTVRIIMMAYQQIINDRLLIGSPPNRPGPMKSTNKVKQQLFILQSLPGIGPVKAKSLIKKFGTLNAIFSSSPNDLKEVPGIGNYLSKKIVSLLNEDRFNYYTTHKTRNK